MSQGKKNIVPRCTTLFIKYFRVTLAIIIITIIAMGCVFALFLTNYWTGSTVDTLKSNAFNVAMTAEGLFSSGRMNEDEAEANLILCNSLNMVSESLGADVFMTDLSGKIVLCKDIIDSKLEVKNEGKCTFHDGYVVPKRIVDATSGDGYYTIDTLEGLYGERSIIVGKSVEYDGKLIGYIYAATPVRDVIAPYAIQMLKLFGGAATISVVIAVILIYLFSYGLTRPLEEMSRITKLYARGDFSKTIKVRGNDELSDLAGNLNAMGQSLAIIEDSRKSFVANVSHELKTPMTSIGGFIDGILDGTIPHSEESKYLRIVSDEVKRLSALVMTMLTLSKIEAGEEKLHASETELRGLLFNALLKFEKPIEDAGINVDGFEDMPSVKVVADENMLYQVAYNLYDNAVKFTNEGGTVSTSVLELPDRVTVSITNSGVGMSEEEQKRVFERFYKVDKSRSEHVKGVGLGLNLAKTIVELHGGEIQVSSIPGTSTTFSFWVPKKQ